MEIGENSAAVVKDGLASESELVNSTPQCQKLKVEGRKIGEGPTDPDAINDGPRGPKEG